MAGKEFNIPPASAYLSGANDRAVVPNLVQTNVGFTYSKKEKKARVQLYLKPENKEKMKEIAKLQERSLTDLIEEAVERYLFMYQNNQLK